MKLEDKEKLVGLVARLTKKQTNRNYFSDMPNGTFFIITDAHDSMPAYELTGYFLDYPPQKTGNGFHYTGYIERGTWEIVGTVYDYFQMTRSRVL